MLHLLDLLGVAVFAVTGAIAAGQKKMDIFGVVVVATVTALGGGTVRDLVIGTSSVFWVSHPVYVAISILAGLGTFIYVYFGEPHLAVLLIADAFGLAIFTVIGCQKSSQFHDSTLIIIVMGVMTGVTGGIIRDLLCGQIPLILRREIYATASLSGGIVFVILRQLGIDERIVAVASVIAVLTVRLISLRWHLSLPVYRAD